MTTISVNKNNGSEDTFRIFHCFNYNVKSLFDFIICHTEVHTSKEKWYNFQMELPAHIFSPAECQCVCNQGIVLPLPCLVWLPQCEKGMQVVRLSQPSHFQCSYHSIWNPGLPCLELMTRTKYFWSLSALADKCFHL